jgi:hypothetical protein
MSIDCILLKINLLAKTTAPTTLSALTTSTTPTTTMIDEFNSAEPRLWSMEELIAKNVFEMKQKIAAMNATNHATFCAHVLPHYDMKDSTKEFQPAFDHKSDLCAEPFPCIVAVPDLNGCPFVVRPLAKRPLAKRLFANSVAIATDDMYVDTNDVNSPDSSPIYSPDSSPILSPDYYPDSSPVLSPDYSPVSSPDYYSDSSPALSPDLIWIPTPVISPVLIWISPDSSPVLSPVSSPVLSSTPSPVSSPVLSPDYSPVSSPDYYSDSSPALSPVSSPVSSPVPFRNYRPKRGSYWVSVFDDEACECYVSDDDWDEMSQSDDESYDQFSEDEMDYHDYYDEMSDELDTDDENDFDDDTDDNFCVYQVPNLKHMLIQMLIRYKKQKTNGMKMLPTIARVTKIPRITKIPRVTKIARIPRKNQSMKQMKIAWKKMMLKKN